MKIVHVRSNTNNVHGVLPWDKTLSTTLCGRPVQEEWTVTSDGAELTCGLCTRSAQRAA